MLGKIAISAAGFGLEEIYRLKVKDRVSKQALVMQLYIQLAHIDSSPHEALQQAINYAEVFMDHLQYLSDQDFDKSQKTILTQASEIE